MLLDNEDPAQLDTNDEAMLGLLTINRLIDPGRRIEYNFLGSINRKAASPRHADTRHRRARRAATRGGLRRARLCPAKEPRHTDAGTRSRARTYHD